MLSSVKDLDSPNFPKIIYLFSLETKYLSQQLVTKLVCTTIFTLTILIPIIFYFSATVHIGNVYLVHVIEQPNFRIPNPQYFCLLA